MLVRITAPFAALGLRTEQIEEYFTVAPRLFGAVLRLQVYPFVGWGVLVLVSLALMVLGPLFEFQPGNNTFGVVSSAIKKGRRRRFVRLPPWVLARRGELAFLYENRSRWCKMWDAPLRTVVDLAGFVFLLAAVYGVFSFDRIRGIDRGILRCPDLLMWFLFCCTLLGLWTLLRVDSRRRVAALTNAAEENLPREGISSEPVIPVGDVMLDVHLQYLEQARKRSTAIERFQLKPGEYVVATFHRAENTDDRQRLEALVRGLPEIAEELPVLAPLHPRTEEALRREGLLESLGRVHRTTPLGYLDMMALLSEARLVITDSGGLQKEAYFQKAPCVTVRDETEWVELVEAGWNRIVPPKTAEVVVRGIRETLAPQPTTASPLYGNGNAAEKIVDALLERWPLST